MSKDEVKAEITKGEWSESFLQMLLRLAESLGEPVSVGELSTIVHPLKFSAMTMISVNRILETRKIPVRLEAIEEKPNLLWFDLKIKMVLLT